MIYLINYLNFNVYINWLFIYLSCWTYNILFAKNS